MNKILKELLICMGIYIGGIIFVTYRQSLSPKTCYVAGWFAYWLYLVVMELVKK